jgi:hypothetical protein
MNRADRRVENRWIDAGRSRSLRTIRARRLKALQQPQEASPGRRAMDVLAREASCRLPRDAGRVRQASPLRTIVLANGYARRESDAAVAVAVAVAVARQRAGAARQSAKADFVPLLPRLQSPVAGGLRRASLNFDALHDRTDPHHPIECERPSPDANSRGQMGAPRLFARKTGEVSRSRRRR